VGFPACDGASLAFIVERTLKTFSNIVAMFLTRFSQRRSRRA
jgi:hypothetical protein